MLRWSRLVMAAGPKLIVLFQLTPLGRGVASPADRELGFPRQQSQSGSPPSAPVEVGRFHRVGAPETALVTAPFSVWSRSRQQRVQRARPMRLFPLGLPAS